MLGEILIFVNNDRLDGATKARKFKRVKMGLVNNALKLALLAMRWVRRQNSTCLVPYRQTTICQCHVNSQHTISFLIHFEGAMHLAQKTSRDVDGISGIWAHVYHPPWRLLF